MGERAIKLGYMKVKTTNIQLIIISWRAAVGYYFISRTAEDAYIVTRSSYSLLPSV